LGIFNQFFTHLLYVPFYIRRQIQILFISNFDEVMPYKARPPSEFLHFTRTLTSKHAY